IALTTDGWTSQTEVIQRFINETGLVNEHGSSENKASRRTALTVMGDLFGDTYTCRQEETKNYEIQLMQEMAGYVKETPLSADSNPLEWWKKSVLKYPHLAQLAKKYLCVPGMYVRSERVFSTAGNTVNKKRAALDPKQVDRLVFLANNI
ncbi:ZBED1 protein, partial [Polyodon spathula]|nr:ZBED1 protein [Polyodon spathula]